VIAIAPLRTSPNGWSDYLQYALSGRWPNAPVQATVQVDNRRVGSTPVVGWPLQPGARTFVVSQSGFITETIAFEARSDATHRAEVVLFPLDAREVRSRHLEESAFYARVMPIYLAMLYAVVAFNLLSVVTGLRRRFFARLLIALVHVPAAVLLWLPAIRLAVALDIPHWVAFSLGSGLIGLLPLALHPARARDRVYAR
jgi:hypothetical protein